MNLDLDTRWNATYLMLEDIEKIEKSFAWLAKDYKPFNAQFGDQGPPSARLGSCKVYVVFLQAIFKGNNMSIIFLAHELRHHILWHNVDSCNIKWDCHERRFNISFNGLQDEFEILEVLEVRR